MIRKSVLFAIVLDSLAIVGCQSVAGLGGQFAPGLLGVSAPAQATITLDSKVRYQTITGWEATASIGEVDFLGQFQKWQGSILDGASDLGINRLRVELWCGAENPVDYFSQYLNGQLKNDEHAPYWTQVVLDDQDSNHINWNGFQFSRLDHQIDNVVLPLKQRLAMRGENLFVNVNYVCFRPSGFPLNEHPKDYAKLVLATYLHMQSKYGFVPDAWEVILEPDNNTGWTGTQVAQAMVAAGERLRANGFKPAFIGPSTADMGHAVTFFDQMVQVGGVLQYWSEFSYHRYGGVSDDNLRAIAERGAKDQLNTAMLEHIGSGYQDLVKDLKVGGDSAWQAFIIGDAWPGDRGGKYFLVDDSDVNNPKVTVASRAKFLRQYFKFIRRGAVRIEAKTTDERLDPVAFVNADSKYVAVVSAGVSGSFSIEGMPAGTYGIKYTTGTQYNIDLPDVTIDTGQLLDTSIPDTGVITVYGKTSSGAPSAAGATQTATVTTTSAPPPTASPLAAPSRTQSSLPSKTPTTVEVNLASPTPSPASAANQARCFLPISSALGMLWFTSSRMSAARRKK